MSNERIRLRATYVVEYEIDPDDYAPNDRADLCVTPQVAADMDSGLAEPGISMLMRDADLVSFRVEPADRAARAPYLHPDGDYVSIGFGFQPDTLLRSPDGSVDRERTAQWVERLRELMGTDDRVES